MSQRKWLLDINIIRVARKCAELVEQEYDTRLPLAHSDFLGRMQAYAETSESTTLKRAARDLATLVKAVEAGERNPENQQEWVEYLGRKYPRWRDGREFRGVYRGAPVYRDSVPPTG